MKFAIEIKSKNENGKSSTFRQYPNITASTKVEAYNWAEWQAREFGLDAVEFDIKEA